MSNYSSGVPMIEIESAIEISELCMLAGRPERAAEFFGSRLTVNEVKSRLAEAAAPTQPPASAASANSGSIFGGPSPAERDRLTEVLAQRFKAVYGKPAG